MDNIYELLEPFEFYSQKALRLTERQAEYIPTSQCFISEDGKIWVKSWVLLKSGIKSGKAFKGKLLYNLLEYLEKETTHVPAYIDPVLNQEAIDELKA